MSNSESPTSAASLSPNRDNSDSSASDDEIQIQHQRGSTKSPISVRSVTNRPARVRKLSPKLHETETELLPEVDPSSELAMLLVHDTLPPGLYSWYCMWASFQPML